MAKKQTHTVKVSASIDASNKASAWFSVFIIEDESGAAITEIYGAWKNASAVKRWFKAMMQEHTPRKSIKLIPAGEDAKGKPTSFSGVLTYKAELSAK